MSFFERAKAAANDLAAKADQAMSNAGIAGPGLGTGAGQGMPGGPAGVGGGAREADAALRDYGLMVWREQHGQPVDATQKEQVLTVLRRLESNGALVALRVGGPAPTAGGGLFGGPTTAPPPPPPGAAAAAAHQPPPPPPPAPSAAPPAPAAPSDALPPPPPPPSWA